MHARAFGFVAALLVVALVAGAQAQNPSAEATILDTAGRTAARERAEASSEASDLPGTELVDLESIPAMEGDEELGELVIIERQSNWQPWSANIQSGFIRTDNAGLASDGFEVTDTYLRSGVGVNYFPTIIGGLFGQVGFRQDFYHYDRYSELNFDYLRASAGLFYSFPRTGTSGWLDWLREDMALFLNYNYYRVTENDLAEELFTNHSINVGVQKGAVLARGHALYCGLSAEPSLGANPSTSQRDEYRWFFSYSVEWTPRLRSLLSYTGGSFDYHDSSRNDLDHYGSLLNRVSLLEGYRGNTSWDFYLLLETSMDLNDSNADYRSYENFNWGGSLGLQMYF